MSFAVPLRYDPVTRSGGQRDFALVVDDEAAVRQALCRLILAGRSMPTTAFAIPRDALRYCVRYRPAIALLDFNMAGFDGVTLARLLRRLHPELPLMFVTGSLDDVDARLRAAPLAPPLELVRKPAASATILQAFARLVPEPTSPA